MKIKLNGLLVALLSLCFLFVSCGSGLPTDALTGAIPGTGSGGGTCTSASLVTGVSPPLGSGAGGEVLTLNGTGFASCDLPSSILIGASTCSSPTFVNSTQITCTTTAGNGGYNDVSATFSGGLQTLPYSFAYHFQKIFLNASGGEGLNRSSAKEAWDGASTAYFNGKLYASWGEHGGVSGSTMQLRVAVNAGTDAAPSWSFVDGNVLATGLNFDPAVAVTNSSLFVMGTDLYVAWYERGTAPATGSQIRVKKYNGDDSAPSWNFVGNSGATAGLNYDQSKDAAFYKCMGFSSKVYCIWPETTGTAVSQMRVKRFDGTSWAFVDGAAATGINKNPLKSANAFPFLIEFNTKLYAIWAEVSDQTGSPSNIRVAVYNGDDTAPTWTFVDGNQAAGIGYNTTKSASRPSAVVYNNKLVIGWIEYNGTKNLTRVARYNGDDSSPVWTIIDGSPSLGLNRADGAFVSFLGVIHGQLVCVFLEGASSFAAAFRIASYNGNDASPAWAFTDGNTATPITNNTGTIYAGGQTVQTFLSDRGYLIWPERAGGGTNNFKVRVLKIQ